MNDDKVAVIVEERKQGFLPYFSSFFTGWLFKDMIENEIRAATKIPKLEASSLLNSFKPSTWREIGKITREHKGVWGEAAQELVKHGGIHAASIIPGAALGYLCLAPVVTRVEQALHHAPADSKVTEASAMGKVEAAVAPEVGLPK